MDNNPSIQDLLGFWINRIYGKYQNKKGQLIRLETMVDMHGVTLARIKCVPCMGYIDILRGNTLMLDGEKIHFEDPSFNFGNVFGPKINNHLWHHQMGPLYEQGWQVEGGVL